LKKEAEEINVLLVIRIEGGASLRLCLLVEKKKLEQERRRDESRFRKLVRGEEGKQKPPATYARERGERLTGEKRGDGQT